MKNGAVINQLENKKREAVLQLLVNNNQRLAWTQYFRDGGFEIRSVEGVPRRGFRRILPQKVLNLRSFKRGF